MNNSLVPFFWIQRRTATPLGKGRPLFHHCNGGFTLVELAAVVFLIGIILALGLPHVIPAIAFGELEGAARHLAGYGRALMAYCALTHEEVTFHVDIDSGEYWSSKWIYPEQVIAGLDAATDNRSTLPAGSPEEIAWQAERMAQRFEQFAKLATQARSRALTQDKLFENSKPLFEKQFDLEWDDSGSEEELKTDLLARTRLPEGVRFKSVKRGTTEYTSGKVESTVTALGLSETLQFELENKDEVYTVEWDAITGNARLSRSSRDEGAP